MDKTLQTGSDTNGYWGQSQEGWAIYRFSPFHMVLLGLRQESEGLKKKK